MPGSRKRNSGADEAGVEAAGEANVGGSLDDGAAILKDGEGVLAPLEAEEHAVAADVSVRAKAGGQLGEVNGAGVLVNLDGVAAAESDVRAALAAQVAEVARFADLAAGMGAGGFDFGPLVGPLVDGKQTAPHALGLAGEKLERLSDLDGSGHVDGGVEDAGGIAGFDGAAGSLGKDAGKAGGLAGQNIHGDGVGTDGGCVDPGLVLLNGVVVEQVAGLKVVSGVEDELGIAEQRVDIAWGEVGDMGFHLNLAIEERNFAASGLGLGQGFAGVSLIKENLALEIAFFDKIAINQGEAADAGAGQQAGGGGSGSSDPDEGDMRLSNALLAVGANAGKKDLSGITLGRRGRRIRHRYLV